MECVEEGLSEAQKRSKADKAAKFIEQMKELETIAKVGGGGTQCTTVALSLN